jgi:hypothetical protein
VHSVRGAEAVPCHRLVVVVGDITGVDTLIIRDFAVWNINDNYNNLKTLKHYDKKRVPIPKNGIN